MSSLFLQEVVLKNRLDELTALSGWVAQIANQLNISARCAFRLELVLTESVTNIIENAYQDAEEHEIKIVLQYENDTFNIQLKDQGLAFNPLQVPEPVLPNRLEEAEVGGLGIHLIRSYTQDCQYQREGNENILTLIISNS